MNLGIKYIPSGSLFLITLLILGIWSIMNLEFRLFPDVHDPQLSSTFKVDQPEKFIESLAPVIITRLEQNPNVIEAGIQLKGNWATVFVRMLSSNIVSAPMQIQENLDEVFNDLTWDGQIPVLRTDNRHEIPITELHISTLDFSTLEPWVRHFIVKELWKIEGIGKLELLGSRKIGFVMNNPMHVPDSLYHILHDMIQSVYPISSHQLENWEYPGQDVSKVMHREVLDGLQMKNVFSVEPVNSSNGWVVRDGMPAIALKIYPSENSDILLVNEELKRVLKQLKNLYPNYQISFFNNRANPVRSKIASMWFTLVSAIIICLILVRISFRNNKMSLWIATVLMLTISTVAILCVILNITLNLISIVGIILGIGMLIDNPIIVGEALSSSGRLGMSHVWRSLIVSNSTTLLVFVPALWLFPYAWELFGGMFLNISLLLFFSMLYSYLVQPWAAQRMYAPSLAVHKKIYCRSPGYRSLWVGAMILTLLVTTVIYQYLRVEFLPLTGARVWNKVSNTALDAHEFDDVIHLIHQYDSEVLNTIEFNEPKLIESGWTAGDDPYQELFRSFNTDQKWYRPNSDSAGRSRWDRLNSKPMLTWWLDTTVAILPEEKIEKEFWQNGTSYRWTIGNEETVPRDQLKPEISYQSEILYRDRRGIYKEIENGEGGSEIQSSLLAPSVYFQVICFTGLILLMLWGYFGSLRLALITILSWPLSIGGSLICLLVAGESLNLFSALAILFTTGISLNDAVLKIDAFRSFQKNGHSLKDSIELACLYRLRPIFLTSITTLASCLILYLFAGTYNQFNSSVAAAISGGIVFSTIGAIWVIPSLLHLLLPSYRTVQPTA